MPHRDEVIGGVTGTALLVLGVFGFVLPSVGLPIFAAIAGVLAVACIVGIAVDVYGWKPASWVDNSTQAVLQSSASKGGTMPFNNARHTFKVLDLGQTDPPYEFQVVRDLDESEYDRTGKVSYLGPGFTLAEASIIEWALQAVAQGETLCTMTTDGTEQVGRRYRGPRDLDYPQDRHSV